MNKANIILVELDPKQVAEYLALDPIGRTKHFAAGLVFGVPQRKVTPEMLELIKRIDYHTPERKRATKVAVGGVSGAVETRQVGVLVHELTIQIGDATADELAKADAIAKTTENDSRIMWSLKEKAVAPKADTVVELKKELAESNGAVDGLTASLEASEKEHAKKDATIEDLQSEVMKLKEELQAATAKKKDKTEGPE